MANPTPDDIDIELKHVEEELQVKNSELRIKANIIKSMKDDLSIQTKKKDELQEKLRTLKLKKKQIKQDVKQFKSLEWTVTDHVIVRYLGRVLDLDMEHIKNSILSDGVKAQASILGDGQYNMEGDQFKGFLLTIKNRSAITLWPKDSKK
jgi:hypothetical protein